MVMPYGNEAETWPAAPPAGFPIQPGTRVGRYVLLDALATGGMGAVYSAHDSELGRSVAIKVLRMGAATAEARHRLVREARAMARLSHPNVVTIYDVGTAFDGIFIAMELVDGRTLTEWLREKPPWREAFEAILAAGRGLSAAHAAGLVHRDFKPDNVLIGKDGRVLVTDFGIARGADDDRTSSGPMELIGGDGDTGPVQLIEPLTQEGTLIGTVGYMAPERAFESRDDARSDQFSFCVTLYYALYGVRPFPYTDASSYFEALLGAPLPPPEKAAVPGWIRNAVMRGLRSEPAHRFSSMAELLDALERDPTRKRRRVLVASGAAALVVSAGLAFGVHLTAVREECRLAGSPINQTWNDSTRAHLKVALTGAGVPNAADIAGRVTGVIDSWATTWAGARREACEATRVHGSRADEVMSRRYACLDGARDDLAAVIDVVSYGDAAIAGRSLNAAYSLSSPRRCLDGNAPVVSAGMSGDPERRDRVLGLRRLIARVGALHSTGKFLDALALGQEGLVEARALTNRQMEVEVLFLVGGCERELGRSAEAVATFQEAMAAAEAVADDVKAAEAAAKVAYLLGDKLQKPHDAERWLALARGIQMRAAPDDALEAELLTADVMIQGGEGHPERSLPLDGRLVTLLERLYGPGHPRVAAAINNEAVDLTETGHFELAVQELRRGIRIVETIGGADNPNLAADYNNVGASLTWLGRYDEAHVALVHALELGSLGGADNPSNTVILASLAVLANYQRNPVAALDAVRRGLTLVEASGDDEKVYLPNLLVERGRALLAQGDAKRAADDCRHALAVQTDTGSLSPDQVYSGDALTCLAQAEAALGRSDEAMAHLERSLTLTRREGPQELPLARFALARLLRTSGRDPARGRALAQSALKDLKGMSGEATDIAAIQSWLAVDTR